ncbi:hypothetical protein PHLGIDRAFT_100544 [Phlebiopsis gigantea 11061_1 CR5-6]|uniref:Palmitoyl-protein thioesterase 1 n=1 Tax=Phlebiopsis gigantea (strain 11061_1 CR5-6) TaxID=745531 RepID=A0A0C3S4Y8_PHLG1|nr:hypothetical protein PHLGIDRAFT_100544 [Phlebiopsis gigantea 11061_1 CR5-6]
MGIPFFATYALLFASSVWSAAVHTPLPQLRPLVIWHGMGDTYDAPGILEFIQEVQDMHPGIFVHSIYLQEASDEDRKAGYFGNVNEQVEFVAKQLNNITELQHGFDAMGFSQGGQFLRAYVERSNSPPVNNLITFGAQHMGVSDLPACKPYDITCQLARRATRNGVYTEWAQANVVQAQYYRDADQLPRYLERNHFLPSINNEVDDDVNATYASNLEALNKLVLVMFAKDTMVVPKESSWFGSYAPADDALAPAKTIIPMRLQPLYTQNRIGLRTLDDRGDLILTTCDGAHMQLSDGCWKPLAQEYTGGVIHLSQSKYVLQVQ